LPVFWLCFLGRAQPGFAQESAPAVSAEQSTAPPGSAQSAAAAPQQSLPTSAASLPVMPALVLAPPASVRGDAVVDYNVNLTPRSAANYFWPLLDAIAINITMWSLPYALNVEWAQISPKYWANNFRTGMQWDDNEFEVNQFGHPYQGGLYFSAARVNGLTFWEAIPYTMFGSFMWEFFMETEQPSINDWMTTNWGGWFFGEVLFRLSNKILDDSRSGSTRLLKEVAAFAVNPVNGIDRLVSGQAWADGPAGKSFPLAMNLRVGADGIGLSTGTGWGKAFRAWIRFEYGDLYAKRTFDVPFEYFKVSAQIDVSNTIFGQGIDGTGVLLGQRFSMGHRNRDLFAWVLSYQYFTNASTKMFTRDASGVYQLGEMGTGPGWFGNWDLGAGFSLDTELDALAVPTGAITSPYAKFEANRTFNYGIGGSLKLEVSLRHKRFGRIYAQCDRYLYYVVDGARGVEHLGTLQLGAYANIYRGHGLGVTVIRYDRSSYYDDYPDLFDAFWTAQVHYELEF
jgi:hypothetical protein